MGSDHRPVGCDLVRCQPKALADFVFRAAGKREAFIQQEFFGNESCEFWLAYQLTLQFTQGFRSSFAAGECDVGIIGPRLWNEPARAGRRRDLLLQLEQFCRGMRARENNAGAVKEANLFQFDRHGRRAKFAKAADQACVLFLAGVPQKLQRNVPCLW